MKKLVLIIFALVFVFAGCSKPAEKPEEIPEKEINITEEKIPEDNEIKITEEKIPENSEEELPEKEVSYQNVDITMPEKLFDMTPESFANRDNDEYIKYLYKILSSTNWPGVTGISPSEYSGFESAKDFSSKILYNVFCTAEEDYYDCYRVSDFEVVIPIEDIFNVLDKYFYDYNLNIDEIGINFEYTGEGKYIKAPGFIGIYPSVGVYYDIESVTDNGDGTVTAVIAMEKTVEENHNFVPTGEIESRRIFNFTPAENSCKINYYRIER